MGSLFQPHPPAQIGDSITSGSLPETGPWLDKTFRGAAQEGHYLEDMEQGNQQCGF